MACPAVVKPSLMKVTRLPDTGAVRWGPCVEDLSAPPVILSKVKCHKEWAYQQPIRGIGFGVYSVFTYGWHGREGTSV